MSQETETKTEQKANTANEGWHVWQVGHYFYAAKSLDEAIEFACHEEEEDRSQMDWAEAHCDQSDYYENIEDGENGYEPTCSMREQAEHLIKSGMSLPFEFATII